MTPTLSRYLMRVFTTNLLFMAFILMGVIWLFDVAELLRRAAKVDGVPLSILMQMGLLKLPDITQTLFPFIILFASLFTFWQLARRSELVVLRAAGVSAWQFLRPILLVGALAGVFVVTILNPLGALFFQKYNNLDNKFLGKGAKPMIALFEEGLWLKQATNDGYAIVHAEKVIMPDWRLNGVFALFFNQNNEFQERIDAPEARLKDKEWVFKNSLLSSDQTALPVQTYFRLPTNLTPREIENSFAKPETMGFWSLPHFIQTLERTGFDSTTLRIHFHGLLSMPALCVAMILLASLVSLRPQRGGGTFFYIIGGVVIGFGVFFLSSLLQALGASHQVPVFLAAWTPALLSILIGSTVLLSLEDG